MTYFHQTFTENIKPKIKISNGLEFEVIKNQVTFDAQFSTHLKELHVLEREEQYYKFSEFLQSFLKQLMVQ